MSERQARMAAFTDVFEHRHDDVTLSAEQVAVARMVDGLLGRGPAARASEPLGFDRDLYARMAAQGLHLMALPESVGGDGASLVDAGLVAESVGRHLAPVGFVEGLAAARTLARAGGGASALAGFAAGTGLTTVALADADAAPAQLVPSGAVADHVVLARGDRLLLVAVRPGEQVPNTAALPLARLDGLAVRDQVELAAGAQAAALHANLVREWRILTAAALCGLAEGALALAVEFAKTRNTRGVPIGSLQAISHALASGRVAVDGARGLWRKAAWYRENEPATRPFQDRVAFVSAARAATDVTTSAVHVHGGAGVTLESDVSLYFRRAKAWANLAGDPRAQLVAIGTAAAGAVR